MIGYALSAVWLVLEHCGSILPRDAVGWLRTIDSNDDQSELVALLRRTGLQSLHDEFALVTLDVLLSLRERNILVHFDEVWLFESMPTAELLNELPSIPMTGDNGPITERPHDAAILAGLSTHKSIIAVLADGDGLNFYCRDESLGRCIRSSESA